ncbi:hypothetical protein, variant 2 [Aphanomyces astaci]|uniref:Rab-GAP TBC domain-containing protein n=1 Tax=Aphanomyces astaci TaxID=112090 RepID=W4FI86_APHAT|nr:hypothetical protein, variant 1 [Aphanomyces astaci]XP_009843362.1 hypothetical protein, variant 2 [Aphanomyces astaci]ETV67190.1 hypothetical protein, variant 1 [Aphanomyces astaci]ETV67191.1 hypothetical protein, variant 2 [Aphanomyces astaci]|eukprot:XP_009843357.1 hypothetical protein, variant 1 [Aphanomyces astaci]
MVEVVVLEGYLHKQSKHLKLWKIRYFVLAEWTLSYSKKSGKKAKNSYELKDVHVIPDQNYVVHDHNFVLDVQYGHDKHMYLSAPTESERLKWTQAIKATRGKWLELTSPDATVDGTKLPRDAASSASSSGFFGHLFQLPDSSASKSKRMMRKKRHATKERKDERKRARMAKMKKPFGSIWLEDVLPHWGDAAALPPHMVEALCFAGIPKELRGRAWSAMLGNRLQINEQLFDICRSRAKAVLLEMHLVQDKDEKCRLESLEQHKEQVNGQRNHQVAEQLHHNSRPQLTLPVHRPTDDTPLPSLSANEKAPVVAEPPTKDMPSVAEQLIADNERNIKLVQRDMPRTFGNHPLFQDGAAGTQKTYDVLEAYTCYRPDLGYVQGMSYLAAILCLHLDSFGAFRAMVSLMSTRLMFDMYRLEEDRTFLYLTVYDTVLKHELPTLYSHFQEIGMDPKMYVVDWAFTLFTRCVPLEVVLRIWDCYIYLGTPFFFQACMGTHVHTFIVSCA